MHHQCQQQRQQNSPYVMSFKDPHADTFLTSSGEEYHTWFRIDKDTVRARAIGLYATYGLFILLAVFADFWAGLGSAGHISTLCSANCIVPGVCQPFTSKCVPQNLFDAEVFCKPGWGGEDCMEMCFCGDESVPCTYGAMCTECTEGFALNDYKCTACTDATTTLEQGAFSTCDYCLSDFKYAAGPPVTCTACPEGKKTDAGPHQDATCALPA